MALRTKKVAVIMGSHSDEDVMSACEEVLSYFGIAFEKHIMSAHRNPEQTAKFAKEAIQNGFGVIIAAAGMAAHLPGVIASHTTLPVIGVPLSGSALNGIDALYAIVQMPKGVPVATMAIGKAGAANAGVFAAQIIAVENPEMEEKVRQFKAKGCRL